MFRSSSPSSSAAWRRRLTIAAVAATVAAGCGGGGGDPVEGSQAQGDCAWLVPAMPDGGACAPDTARTTLASWRASQPPLEREVLNLLTYGADPIEAARLQAEQGFLPPGRDLPRWPLSLPLAWDADPFHDANWQFQLNAWRAIDPLLIGWERNGDPALIDTALLIVADWHRFHVQENRSSAYGWNDMATGIRAMKMGWLLDRWLRGDIEVEVGTQALLLELGERHARMLRKESFLSDGNHGLFQLHGLIALCRALPYLSSCDGGIDYAKRAFDRLLRLQFTDEGVHREHSPEYHMFVTKTLTTMAGAGWYEDFATMQRLLPLAIENLMWMFHPDRKLVAVGDSIEGGNFRFPAGDPACATRGAPADRCYLLKAFPKSGYAIARSDHAVPEDMSSMLFFTASFFSPGHKHADDLGFELFEFGERVLTDTGKYKYAADDWRRFAQSTRAHNTLELDGESQSLAEAEAYGSGLTRTMLAGGRYEIVGEATNVGTGRSIQRRLFYEPRRSLLVVDEVRGPAPATVTEWFHFAPQVRVVAADIAGRYEATLGSGRRIEIESLRGACSGRVYRGETSPIQGWSTVEYGVMTPRDTIGLTCSGGASAYATLFVLDTSDGDAVRAETAALLAELGLAR